MRFLDLHYKIHADSDQVAKFQGYRSRELGERVTKKKKENITGKTEDLPLLRTGGLKINKMPEFKRFLPKKYQNTRIFMLFARNINKTPEFYTIFARKMPEFYILID